VWQSPTCLGGPSTKLISENKGGLDNRQPRVVKFEYPTVLSGKENVGFDMCYCPKNGMVIPLEMSDKCISIRAQHPKKIGATN